MPRAITVLLFSCLHVDTEEEVLRRTRLRLPFNLILKSSVCESAVFGDCDFMIWNIGIKQ